MQMIFYGLDTKYAAGLFVNRIYLLVPNDRLVIAVRLKVASEPGS